MTQISIFIQILFFSFRFKLCTDLHVHGFQFSHVKIQGHNKNHEITYLTKNLLHKCNFQKIKTNQSSFNHHHHHLPKPICLFGNNYLLPQQPLLIKQSDEVTDKVFKTRGKKKSYFSPPPQSWK